AKVDAQRASWWGRPPGLRSHLQVGSVSLVERDVDVPRRPGGLSYRNELDLQGPHAGVRARDGGCRGCSAKVDAQRASWWGRPPGLRSHLQVGSVSLVERDVDVPRRPGGLSYRNELDLQGPHAGVRARDGGCRGCSAKVDAQRASWWGRPPGLRSHLQ